MKNGKKVSHTENKQENKEKVGNLIEPKDKLEKEITEEKSKQSSLNNVELVLYDTEEIYEKEENEKKLRYLKKKKKDKTVITLMKKGKKLRTKKTLGTKIH